MSVNHAAVRTAPQAPAEMKCCRKCAFRVGSQERSDPYGWMQLVEGWREDGDAFLCHESIPGHPGECIDGRPRHRRCAGWAACSAAKRWPRATPDAEWFAEQEAQP
jgi:hypothetical protein